MRNVAGVILAGGKSTRMGGGDKFLRPLFGRPLLAHVIERLQPQVESLALNANGDVGRLKQFQLPVIPDTLPDSGPLSGVLAALRWAQQLPISHSHVVIAACDTPFFPTDLVQRLQAAADDPATIVLARSRGRLHPTFARWPTSLADELEAFLRREKSASMRAFAGKHNPAIAVNFTADEGLDPFFNINTPDDLRMAEQQAGGRAS